MMTSTGHPAGYASTSRKATARLREILHGIRCSHAEVRLLGFSKGGVVLNQVLYEMADAEQCRCKPEDTATRTSDLDELCLTLDAITEVFYLDAGLNSPGVHIVEGEVIEWLGRRHRRVPLRVHLLGTPRQWGDQRRPWIREEKDKMRDLLQTAGVDVREQQLLTGHPATLETHFGIIPALRPYLGC